MTEASMLDLPLLPPFALSPLAALLVGGACAFLLTYLFTFGVIALSKRFGWLDKPSERRVHKNAVPRLGGVAMFLSFALISLLFYTLTSGLQSKEIIIYWLFLAGSVLIVAVHAYDDVKGLKPWPKLLAQTLTVLIVLGPFGSKFWGVLFYGFNNPIGAAVAKPGLPWYRVPEITLFIHNPEISLLAIPAILFTWFWMVGMMNTVNLIDGLDGLATGVVAITGIFITIISWTLHQQSIAILSMIFTGAVLGFLPHNWNPAKIFMGDSGSQFLGLGLAVLSIIGGAKVALALMVLGIPILDVAIVMINRIRRGQHPLHYDKTHLHHRLLATGLSVKQICYVFYCITILFGILALSLPRIYKIAGIALVGIVMIALVVWIDRRQRERGIPMKLDGSPQTPPTTPYPTSMPSGESRSRDDTDLYQVHEASMSERNTPSEYEAQREQVS
jgi:UDP-GlcNAc:undecaprenyl-phosphate GlcNAc-1-phosphate transferase